MKRQLPGLPRAPMGPFGVIPQPFRMVSHFERMAFSNGKPSQMEGHSEWKAIPNGKLMESYTTALRYPKDQEFNAMLA